MAIKKIAVSEGILPHVVPIHKIAGSPAAMDRFSKVLAALKDEQRKKGYSKVLSPKVDDFLYASCIMMHAAEASLINQATGEPILGKSGEAVSGVFVKFTDHKGRASYKWEASDNIKPYKNGNGDIFPEEDLLTAHKEWIGKPLCRDHVSSTVDGIRGIIIDTYYDAKFKRVHALFALDRKNYADLARKVEAGYATSVSMGTAVGKSICTDCGNVATTEAEYCAHVKNKSCYGEINKELAPIELSIVVTGADPAAKIKTVLAHLKEYEDQAVKMSDMQGVDADKLEAVKHAIGHLKEDMSVITANKVSPKENREDINEKATALLKLLGSTDEGDGLFDEAVALTRQFINTHSQELASLTNSNLDKLIGTLNHLNLAEEKASLLPHLFERTKGVLSEGDVQVGNNEQTLPLTDSGGESLRSNEDFMQEKSYKGRPGEPFFGNALQNFSSLYTEDTVKTTNYAPNLHAIESKIAFLADQISDLKNDFNKEKPMSFADLKKRALERKSYYQGTEDPEVLPYPRMGDDNAIREKEDRQMVGDELDTSADNPDLDDKKMLQRAELEKRMARRAELLNQIKNAEELKDESGQVVAVKDSAGKVKPVVSQTADDGKAKAKAKKEKEEKEAKAKKEKEAKAKKEKEDKAKKEKAAKDKKKAAQVTGVAKTAYHQGTEEASVLPYPLMGDQDGLRLKQDRHMLQTGPMGGDVGAVPGDEALKKGLQRIANKKLNAKLFKGGSPAESRWDFFAGVDQVLSVTASQVYGNMLGKKVAGNQTLGDFFHSREYGSRVLKLIRAAGPEGAATEMGLPPEPVAPIEAPEAELDMGREDAEDEDLNDLREALNAAIEKLEVGLEDLKSAATEEEGVADLSVTPLEAEVGGVPEELPPEVPMPPTVSSVSDRDMLEAYAFLNDIVSELCYIDSQFEQGKDNHRLVPVATAALADATLAMRKGSTLVKAYRFNKKAAALAAAVVKTAEEHMEDGLEGDMEDDCGDGMRYDSHEEPMADDGDDKDAGADAPLSGESLKQVEEIAEEVAEEVVAEEHEEEMSAEDVDFMLDGAPMTDDSELEGLDLTAELQTRLAQRQAWREALVSQAGQYDDVYEGEHGGPGPTLGLDGDDKVENLHEVHDAMLDVATKDESGPKVREAAAKLNEAIKTGGVNPNKLNELVALGAVDAETANYWKNFYGQVDGGAEFAQGLIKDFSKKASAENEDTKIIRYKRAYMLGMQAQEKNLCGRTTAALNDFVDNMVNLPDKAFNSFKNLVAQTKTPSRGVMPQAGMQSENLGLRSEASLQEDDTAPTVENLASVFLLK